MVPTYEKRLRVCSFVAQRHAHEFIAHQMGQTPKQLKRNFSFELAHGDEVMRVGLLVPMMQAALGGDRGMLKRVRKELGSPPLAWSDLEPANQDGEAHFRKDGALLRRTGPASDYRYEVVQQSPAAALDSWTRPRTRRSSPMVGYPEGEAPHVRRGRPKRPTEEERLRIAFYAAADASDEVIAYLTNQHVETLRSRFADELRFGKNRILHGLFVKDTELAKGGSGPAADRALAAIGKPKRRAPFREPDEVGMERVHLITFKGGPDHIRERVEADAKERKEAEKRLGAGHPQT